MKEPTSTRRYAMKARAKAAAQTAEDILLATVALWRERPIDEVTLQAIAERAGVSVQTVIRRFGSKEGVFSAAIEEDAAGIRLERGRAAVGDVDRALDVILAHYERDGDIVLRTIGLEERVPAAAAIINAGRSEHRAWCARVFAPLLPKAESTDFEARLDAFVAATDLYVWKLFRRDLDRSADDTRRAMRTLLDGLTSLHRE